MSEPFGSLEFRALTREDAGRIADWRYPDEYGMYDIPSDDRESSVEYMLDPASGYFGAYDDGELVGFCSMGPDGRVPGWDYDDSAVDVGAGMRPDLTGRGRGVASSGRLCGSPSRRSGRGASAQPSRPGTSGP